MVNHQQQLKWNQHFASKKWQDHPWHRHVHVGEVQGRPLVTPCNKLELMDPNEPISWPDKFTSWNLETPPSGLTRPRIPIFGGINHVMPNSPKIWMTSRILMVISQHVHDFLIFLGGNRWNPPFLMVKSYPQLPPHRLSMISTSMLPKNASNLCCHSSISSTGDTSQLAPEASSRGPEDCYLSFFCN